MINISERNKGLITGLLVCFVYFFFFYIRKAPLQGTADYVSFAVYIAGIAWSLLTFSNANAGAGFKEIFNAGFRCFIMATLLIVIFMAIINIIHPELRENIIRENNLLLLQEGSRTPAEIEENAGKFRSLYLPFVLIGTVLKYLVLGAVVSLAGAALLSQNNRRRQTPYA
ncbi:MAG: DUF4199 family protein [Ferruginibacter sp.]